MRVYVTQALPHDHTFTRHAKYNTHLQISKFSLEEKVNISTGVGWTGGRCVVRISLHLRTPLLTIHLG